MVRRGEGGVEGHHTGRRREMGKEKGHEGKGEGRKSEERHSWLSLLPLLTVEGGKQVERLGGRGKEKRGGRARGGRFSLFFPKNGWVERKKGGESRNSARGNPSSEDLEVAGKKRGPRRSPWFPLSRPRNVASGRKGSFLLFPLTGNKKINDAGGKKKKKNVPSTAPFPAGGGGGGERSLLRPERKGGGEGKEPRSARIFSFFVARKTREREQGPKGGRCFRGRGKRGMISLLRKK